MDLFSSAVKLIIPSSVQQSWIDAILNFNSDPLFALLICSGAVIEELDWEFHRKADYPSQNNASHDHPDRNFYLFNYLRDTASRPKERPRMCVKSINLHNDMGYDTGDVLDGGEAGTLLTMQNLQSLKMSKVAAGGGDWFPDLTSGEEEEVFACYSKLETLEITGCCFDAEAMQTWVSCEQLILPWLTYVGYLLMLLALAELKNLSCGLSPISYNHATGEGDPHQIVAAVSKTILLTKTVSNLS